MSLFAKAFTQMNEDPELATLENEDAIEAELANEATEIVEAEQTVEEEDTAVEELDGRAETLEEMEETIEQMINDGEGMSRQTAKAYQIAFKGLIGSVLPNPVGTLQSFGADSTRLEATRLTQQGISDTLKKIWEAIKGAVLRAIAAIKDFFAKLFGGTSKVKTQLEGILKKIEEAQKEQHVKKDGKVKVGNGVRIHVNGSVESKDVSKGVEIVAGDVAAAFAEAAEQVPDFYEMIANKMTSAPDVEALADAGEKILGAKPTLAKLSAKIGMFDLPGGKTLIMEGSGEADVGGKLSAWAKIRIGDHPKRNAFKQKNEVDAASLPELKQMIQSAIKMIEIVDGKKKVQDELKAARDKAIKAGDELVKKADAGKLGSYWDQAKIRVALRLTNRSFNGMLSSFSSYCFSTARAVGAYANQHLAHYKKPA